MRIEADKTAQVVHLFAEGVGIRATSRLTGLDQGTILRILEAAGEHCIRLLDAKVHGVKPKFVEVDEIWSFVRCKQINARPFTEDGDQYTFSPILNKNSRVLATTFDLQQRAAQSPCSTHLSKVH